MSDKLPSMNAKPGPTWFTAMAAIAAVSAVIVAMVQIADERSARRALEQEQVDDEVRAQAEKISAWPVDDPDGISRMTLSNTSSEPIYRVVLTMVFVEGAGPHAGTDITPLNGLGMRRAFAVIPPGRYRTTLEARWGGMSVRPGAELAFTDQGGHTWLRTADGALNEIDEPAASYYGLPEPVGWELP